jgi:hypothetical protein
MSQPVQIDSITFDEALDFKSFVRDVLAGKSGVPARPDDPLPVAWLDRAYPRLASTPYGDKLGHAVADALNDGDPSVRLQALMFFEHNPTAPGGERVIAFARTRHAHFHGVPNPEHPNVDLGWQLLMTLGSLVRKDVSDAKAAAHAIVLQSGQAAPLIGSLSKVDPDWVSKHAEEIVRATPAAASPMLINLELAGADVTDVGVRIAPLVAHDSTFRENLKRLDDHEARSKIVAAMRTKSTNGN